ncbi:MAG: fasciclin domain-containing protein [Flavobacteriaceae bacterium]|nr:fasciclin domain-containing protein [Flavobacteriaceae bacterium]
MNPKFLIRVFASLLILVAFVACNSGSAADTEASNSEKNSNLSEISTSNKGQAFIDDESDEPNALRLAIDSPDHTTLVAAVQAAGVENALVNVGPLTVFAPTNAAFDKIDKATLEDLLKPENKSKLAYILTHHVAPSNYPIETLKRNVEKNRKLYMASGEYLEVTQEGDDIYVGGTKIVGSVNVSNGWVHVVEDVILPKN